jgi:predicted nuclease of restriction endonuclease-like (RecB) superfamily
MSNPQKTTLTFDRLVSSIRQVHERLASQASRAVNISLTLRNWAIGFYIREYEQKGFDRAGYGQNLIVRLADELKKSLDRCYTDRYLRLCRQFYETYPEIRKSVISKFDLPDLWKSPISDLSGPPAGVIAPQIEQKLSPQMSIPADKLMEQLSFTHITELLKCEDPLKRAFYEIECVRGNWSVRELKRQIGSLYYERSALSKDKAKLAKMVRIGAETTEARLTVRDPYVFEFLGIKPREVMGESDLEDALLDKLQDFLLELGHGFCLEARQKRILIGDTHGFVDLVFYHRVLKCHVLVELKVSAFSHEHLGQLNTYVNWYSKHVKIAGDNAPVGILLCTHKDHALVEYALAGMDNYLFVSKYQLELPKKEDIRRFIEEQVREVGDGQGDPSQPNGVWPLNGKKV